MRGYAKNNGYGVARECVDEAKIGRIADRPEFCQMIDEGGKATAPFPVIQLIWLGPNSQIAFEDSPSTLLPAMDHDRIAD